MILRASMLVGLGENAKRLWRSRELVAALTTETK